jgi:tRNA(Ile)-lysidine synthase TilS/MesJ
LSYEPIKYKGEYALRTLLDAYRNKGKKYDCIVPVSGGRDSAYVLYNMVEVYKMRTLAYNYDNGFASEQAKENLKNIRELLDVDFISIKSKKQTQKLCLINNIKAWARKPSSEPFPTFCYGCKHGYLGGAYKIARIMKIPLIILGSSQMEESRFKEALGRYHKSYLIHLFIKFMRNPFYLNPKNICTYLFLNVEFPLIMRNNSIKIIQFFDYIEYDEKKMLSVVASKLNWKKDENLDASWRFDCQVHAIIDYMFRKKLGFTEKDEMYSLMIRNGKLTRAEALERIEKETKVEKKLFIAVNEILKKLNLSKNEKDRILFCW